MLGVSAPAGLADRMTEAAPERRRPKGAPSPPSVRTVAAIGVREDHEYLESCLLHLLSQGVDYALIDNGMSAASKALLRRPVYAAGLVGVWTQPFNGVFELERQLDLKEEIFAGVEADWLVHLDIDEMMQSPVEGERLAEAFARVDAAGYTVIDFDEFIFLPIDAPYRPGAAEQPMLSYYYFNPSQGPRLMRARKKSAGLSTTPPQREFHAGGHRLFGDALRVSPEAFIQRHYLVRDAAHGRRKYTDRAYSPAELERGWHANRVGYAPNAFTLPAPHLLKRLPHAASRAFDRSDARTTHFWQWAERPDRRTHS